MLNNLSVKAKLSVGNAILLVCLLGFSGYFYLGLTSTINNTQALKNYIFDQAKNGSSLLMVKNITVRDQLQKDYQLRANQQIKTKFTQLGVEFEQLLSAAKTEADQQQASLLTELSTANSQLTQLIETQMFPLVDDKLTAASIVNNQVGPLLEKMSVDLTEFAIKDSDSELVSISSRLTQKLLASRAYFNLYLSTGSATLLERSELEVAGIYYQLIEMKKIASRQKSIPLKQLRELTEQLEQEYIKIAAMNKRIDSTNTVISEQTQGINEKMLNQILSQWKSLDKDAGHTLETVSNLRQNGLLVILAIIVASLSIIWFIGDNITKGLRQLLDRLVDISDGDGDLTKRVELNSRDEIGQLANSFNTFIEQIQNLVANSQRSSSEVEGYANSNVTMAVESKAALEQQLGETNSISVSIEELSASAKDISVDTAASNDIVNTANDSVNSGIKSSHSSVESVEQLHIDINMTHEVIGNLAKEATAIGGVIGVIKSMTQQTNLLALNAAIEAARAGEAGRGFAVVADEVRSLANRTQGSAQEIETIITNLQAESDRAVSTIESSLKSAQINKDHVIDTQNSFTEIEQSLLQLKETMSSVASACNEQSQVTNQVSEKVTTVYALSQRSAEISDQSAKTSEQSASSIVRLNGILNQFKV
ncbi:MAG: methyl-accepting chemotaxis protein [Pseudomonadales bacterium]|nr:methyl-accepting chemotaxis protein [Pseudomonadales bacterium]NRA17282.1 methyl-accepting chemotaxis protein [Oceanospirillaceae bacterium]